MTDEVRWPKPGDKLVHRFRGRPSEVVAEVISVNEGTRKIVIRVNGVEYKSLSAAARSITGSAVNGWIYWGLKKQLGSRRK